MSFKRVLCSELPKSGRSTLLDEEEAAHLTRVMRLGDGAPVIAMDARGSAIEAKLRVAGKRASVEAAAGAVIQTERPGTIVPLTLEMAALKGDSMDWAIEKAVELGVAEIRPLITAHTVVQLGRKSPEEFRDRWQKVADQSLKQCERLTRLILHTPIPMTDLWTTSPEDPAIPRVACEESSRLDTPELGAWIQSKTGAGPLKGLRVLLGPEGGWSEHEKELLGRTTPRVSLGPLILRGETASIYVASVFASLTRVHG